MKKLLTGTLAALFALSLAACEGMMGRGDSGTGASSSGSSGSGSGASSSGSSSSERERRSPSGGSSGSY